MLGKRFGDNQNTAAPSNGHGCLSTGFARRGESVVELTELRDRISAVSERDVMAVRTAVTIGCRLMAIAKPAGKKKRPRAAQKAGNVCSAGSTANLMAAAQTTAPATPSANARAPPQARSPLGESNRINVATNT